MQTIIFLQTAHWVISQYSEETKATILRGEIQVKVIGEERGKHLSLLLRCATELAVVAERLNAHTTAPAVLRAFSLEELLDRAYAVSLAEAAVASNDKETGRRDLISVLHRVSTAWWMFESCIGPVEKLVVPDAVIQETDFDDILTLELLYENGRHPKAETVAKVLENVSVLYAALSRGLSQREFPPLVLVYADSGSDIRLDFTGLGEPIKEIKWFLVELWNRFRHRRADDYRANAEAFLGGLRAVAGLDALRQQGALTDEDVARYRRDILEAGVRLFEAGTLPREIPRVEPVNNERLIAEVQRKLLPASSEAPGETTSVATRVQTKRKKVPKRRNSR